MSDGGEMWVVLRLITAENFQITAFPSLPVTWGDEGWVGVLPVYGSREAATKAWPMSETLMIKRDAPN